MYKEQAFEVLKNSSTEAGFLATAVGDENYNRVWSRDSAIAAVAILLHRNENLYPSIKASILTLAIQQNRQGMIPSNVSVDAEGNQQASFGTLVGRVDAQTWWVIQSCLYILVSDDHALKNQLKPQIFKVLDLLDAWEFNARNLIYTPLGGNWADEYVLSGYTLYDNLLRYWALILCQKCWPSEGYLSKKISNVRSAILFNFGIDQKAATPFTIHPRIYQDLQKNNPSYLPACFDAAQYSQQWDAAANGLAILLGFRTPKLNNYLQQFERPNQGLFVPSFWPVIQTKDPAWALLENQYNYSFKNEPYHFHNGGSWPVMSGLLAMGLQHTAPKINRQITETYEDFLKNEDEFRFSEYISTNDFKPCGKQQMCFSASGYLFMCATTAQINSIFSI